jgi:hypothetical protein
MIALACGRSENSIVHCSLGRFSVGLYRMSHQPNLSIEPPPNNGVHAGPRRHSTSSIPYNPSIKPSDVGLTPSTPMKMRVNSGTAEDIEHYLGTMDVVPHDIEGHGVDYEDEGTIGGGESIGIAGGDDLKSSGIDISDIQHIHQSLNYVRANNFHGTNASKREKLPPILMYEINCLGESVYTNMTLRELLTYVNQEAQELDEEFYKKAIELQQKMAKIQQEQHKSFPDHHIGTQTNSHVMQPNHENHHLDQHVFSHGNVQSHSNTFHRDIVGNKTMHTTQPSTKAFDSVRELRLRDLRRLDFQFNPNEEKLILIRRHAVLIAMVSILLCI